MKPHWQIGNDSASSNSKQLVFVPLTKEKSVALVPAACSGHASPVGSTLFVFRLPHRGKPPVLFEVAFDSFSTTRRSETSIPIASVEAPGELGYLWNKPAGVTSNGSGFVTGGHAYGPQGPMSPVESSEMYLAQLDSRWNGSHFVPTDARGVIDPPISLLYS